MISYIQLPASSPPSITHTLIFTSYGGAWYITVGSFRRLPSRDNFNIFFHFGHSKQCKGEVLHASFLMGASTRPLRPLALDGWHGYTRLARGNNRKSLFSFSRPAVVWWKRTAQQLKIPEKEQSCCGRFSKKFGSAADDFEKKDSHHLRFSLLLAGARSRSGASSGPRWASACPGVRSYRFTIPSTKSDHALGSR